MRHSIGPTNSLYEKEFEFYDWLKNIGTHATKAAKNMSKKFSEKLLDRTKKSTTNTIKTASKRAIQKTAEATGDLIGNKIADKIRNLSKKSSRDLPSHNDEANNKTEIPKERYVYPEKRQ